MHLYVHGVALTAWFALALIQPWLIESGRITLHRRLGIVGVSLAIGVVITGLWTLALRDAPVIDDFSYQGGWQPRLTAHVFGMRHLRCLVPPQTHNTQAAYVGRLYSNFGASIGSVGEVSIV